MVSIGVGYEPSTSLHAAAQLALVGVLTLALMLALIATAVMIAVARRGGRPHEERDRALLRLGEARGRQAILDDVRMLEHGQLKAHVLAVQHCIEQLCVDGNDDARRIWLPEAQAQIHRLLDVVTGLHRAAHDSALPDDFEQTMVDVARSLATAYPNCACHVEVTGQRVAVIPEPTRRALTLVLYNALTNAFTHGQPAHVTVQLQYAPDALILVVADDGCGAFPLAHLPQGRGLRDIRELVGSLGGTITLASGQPTGTTLTATLPLLATALQRTHGGTDAPLSLPEPASD